AAFGAAEPGRRDEGPGHPAAALDAPQQRSKDGSLRSGPRHTMSKRRAAGRLVGNDVVDLAAARERWDDSDARWIARHLTRAELESLDIAPAEDRMRLFWSFFAAKEAASKAFAQAGIETPRGGFTCIEVDRNQARARDLASGKEAALLFPRSDE